MESSESSHNLHLQFCENCKLHYFPDIERNTAPNECNICKGTLIDTEISFEEYKNFPKTKRCPKCKRKYPKLFLKCSKCNTQLIKLSTESKQAENQIAQIMKQTQFQEQPNIPKCPICQSTDLAKISTAKKAGKIILFGIFGAGDVGKTWKCNNCGSKF